MRSDLLLDLRNRRLRSFLANGQEIISCVDVRDRFFLEKRDRGINAVSFNSKPNARQDGGVELINFVGRVNDFPWTWDFSPVLNPLVQRICSLTIASRAVSPIVHLYYLLPLNASENLWQGVPSEPFDVNGITISPAGYISELITTLAGVVSHILDHVDKKRFGVFFITHVDSVPTILLLSFNTIQGQAIVSLESIFPVDHVKPGLFPENVREWFVMWVDDDTGSEDLNNALRTLTGCGVVSVSELPSLATQDLFSRFFSDNENNGSQPLRLVLQDHSCFLCGNEACATACSTKPVYPEHRYSRIALKPGERRSRLTFFRGHVADPRYCYRFRPFEFEPDSLQRRYLVKTTLSSVFDACVELFELAPDGSCATEAFMRDMSLPRPVIC